MPDPSDPAIPLAWDQLIARSGLPRLEARALLAHASGRSREWLIAHGDEAAPAAIAARFEALACRRAGPGEPLAYLTGEREFHGRVFLVSDAVLIPRPETEELVDAALEFGPAQARVLDLGTGSGCIAVTLACLRTDWTIVATDRSEAALAVASRNAGRLCPDALASGRLGLAVGDWFDALARQARFDLIVSNPPYVAGGDPHLLGGDLRYEPESALASGDDGLDALRRIAAGAPERLDSGGWLLVEHGFAQGEAVRALFSGAGLVDVSTRRDGAGRERITLGRKPTPSAGKRQFL